MPLFQTERRQHWTGTTALAIRPNRDLCPMCGHPMVRTKHQQLAIPILYGDYGAHTHTTATVCGRGCFNMATRHVTAASPRDR